MRSKKGIIKLLILIAFALNGINTQAQEQDSILGENIIHQRLDSLQHLLTLSENKNITLEQQIASQTTEIDHLEEQTRLLQQMIEKMEQENLFNKEKQGIYNEAKEKEIVFLEKQLKEREEALKIQKETTRRLEEEKERNTQLMDSLKNNLNEAEKKIIRINEELKYTQQRAKEAEAKINAATAKKKKVVAIQGIALKTFRTPNWSIAPDKIEDGTIVYRIVNKNGGNAKQLYYNMCQQKNVDPNIIINQLNNM